ncbi:hypothetical protein SFA35_14990 [Pseudomonas sp. HR96]|uniref:hypothetical protein n=1 Tax=Pseudomonas sp. HR96 TaxID=1027966 RepID=UPI002A74DD1C|nr:hypothetical protein [Pseudomonas sp. HR96]WPO97955.1 hypothetical protein SFA35_14990 [Pseudomonas sp. HR96]
MQQLSQWFPWIDQMPPSLKAFCGIAVATVVAAAVVIFVVVQSRRNARTDLQ